MANPRAEYSPIFHRKPLRGPDDARIIVWPVINVEEWDINSPMARTVLPNPQGVSLIPDIPNFGWFDYGLPVGFWRLKQVLDKPRSPGHGKPQRVGLSQLSPVGARKPEVRLGDAGPWVYTEGHQQRARRAGSDPPHHQHHSGVHGHRSQGLDGAGLG